MTTTIGVLYECAAALREHGVNPLSAEELAWACDNFSPHAMEGMAFRELREARAKIAALRGALEDLMDEQNGPPLIRDAASWRAAMDNALRVLAGKEAQSE